MKFPSFRFLPLWQQEGVNEKHAREKKRQREAAEEARRRRVFLFGYLAIMLEKERQNLRYRDFLTLEGVIRRDRRIPRVALVDPATSPWEKVYQSGNDQAMITVTALDQTAFRNLLKLFRPFFYNYTPWTGNKDGSTYVRVVRGANRRTGRPRLVKASSCLGLSLAWYRFKGAEFILQGWFGFTGTHANVWLKFGRRMLIKVLLKLQAARVTMPSEETVAEHMRRVEARHPALQNVYCVADGLKLYFESCDGLSEQSMFYNGWQHDHYISNLFVFSIDGQIISCVVNAPGSVHDSTLAYWGKIYDILEAMYERTGGICCVDSAFMANDDVPFLIKSAQDVSKARSADEMVKMQQATSLRQAAEWGMRAIQGAFPRSKERFHYEENGERKVYVTLLCLLYNYRIETVGLNQIRTVYVPEWQKDRDITDIYGSW